MLKNRKHMMIKYPEITDSSLSHFLKVLKFCTH